MRTGKLRELEKLLLSSTLTVPVIAVRLNSSESTIRRAIKQLVALGSDVRFHDGVGWHANVAVFLGNKKGKR